MWVAGKTISIGTFLKTMTWFYQTMTLFYQSSAIVLLNIDVVLTFDWDDTEKSISPGHFQRYAFGLEVFLLI